MEGTYEVVHAGKTVGNVTVTRQGMFYCISCRCHLSGDVAYKLVGIFEQREIDLGLLVPERNAYGLYSRINMKIAGMEKPVFVLRLNRSQLVQKVDVSPKEPFGYLAKLENAYLVKNNGKIHIGFRNEK